MKWYCLIVAISYCPTQHAFHHEKVPLEWQCIANYFEAEKVSGDLKCIAFADGNCPNWFPLSPPLAASASEDCQTWDAMQCGMRLGCKPLTWKTTGTSRQEQPEHRPSRHWTITVTKLATISGSTKDVEIFCCREEDVVKITRCQDDDDVFGGKGLELWWSWWSCVLFRWLQTVEYETFPMKTFFDPTIHLSVNGGQILI